MTGIVPTSGWGYQYVTKEAYREVGYGPQWEGAYVILSWYVHLYTGDTRIRADHYAGVRRYLDHLTRHAEDGLLRFGIDDHAPALTKTPPEDFATGFYYQIARIVSQSARILGKSEDAQRYEKLAESIFLRARNMLCVGLCRKRLTQVKDSAITIAYRFYSAACRRRHVAEACCSIPGRSDELSLWQRRIRRAPRRKQGLVVRRRKREEPPSPGPPPGRRRKA